MTGKEKFLKVQQEIKVPKGQYNSFGKYSYRSAEDILEEAKKALGNYRMYIRVEDNILLIGDRYYIEAVATVYDAESDWELSAKAYAREPVSKKGMDESQITGTASSYARKYAMNGLFGLDDNKDPDTDEHAKITGGDPPKKTTKKEQSASKEILATQKQISKIIDLLSALDSDVATKKEQEVLKHYRKASLDDLTIEEADQIIRIGEDRWI